MTEKQIGLFGMGKSFTIARMFGIEIRADFSWLVIAALIFWSLGSHYFPTNYPELSLLDSWSLALGTTAFLYVSVAAHELGHVLGPRQLIVEARAGRCVLAPGQAVGNDQGLEAPLGELFEELRRCRRVLATVRGKPARIDAGRAVGDLGHALDQPQQVGGALPSESLDDPEAS